MYDKVKLWIDRAIVDAGYPLIANYLDRGKQEADLETGEIKTFGSIGGLKVSVFPNGVSIIGSLPKFLYGSNVYPLDRHATAQSIEKISDKLHFNAEKADVKGVEFGTNFLMKHPVADYLAKLGEMPRLHRYHVEQQTLYYKGKQQRKVLCFYDKAADAKAKGIDCPLDGNLLRYEMRLNWRLAKMFNVPEVKASTLAEAGFYRAVMRRYQSSYFSISKQNQIKPNAMNEIKTVSDAFNVFVARLINQSDPTQILEFLDELKKINAFEDRKYYSRLKAKIKEVASKEDITVSDELVKELDNEIKKCGAYV